MKQASNVKNCVLTGRINVKQKNKKYICGTLMLLDYSKVQLTTPPPNSYSSRLKGGKKHHQIIITKSDIVGKVFSIKKKTQQHMHSCLI
jgi:hypothetical protein